MIYSPRCASVCSSVIWLQAKPISAHTIYRSIDVSKFSASIKRVASNTTNHQHHFASLDTLFAIHSAWLGSAPVSRFLGRLIQSVIIHLCRTIAREKKKMQHAKCAKLTLWAA